MNKDELIIAGYLAYFLVCLFAIDELIKFEKQSSNQFVITF